MEVSRQILLGGKERKREREVSVLLLISGLLSELCSPSGPVKLPQLFLFGGETERGVSHSMHFILMRHTNAWMQYCHSDPCHSQNPFVQEKDSTGPGLDVSAEFRLLELRCFGNLHAHTYSHRLWECVGGDVHYPLLYISLISISWEWTGKRKEI